MGFLDKAKAAAEQAATRAKEGVEEVQGKRNLSRAYEDLGRTAFDLIESGQISNDRLTAQADEVRAMQAQAAAADPVGTSSPPPPPAGSPPPPPAGSPPPPPDASPPSFS